MEERQMKVKSFDRKEELLSAALDEFLAKSYDEASLNNIIKNAGISKGTFYYHFKDKQALYLSLLQSLVDLKLEIVGRKLKNYSHNEDLNIFENFKLQARFGAELAKEQPKYYMFGLMFLREKGNKIYEVAMDMLGDTSEKYFEEMLNQAIEKGELRAGVSTNFSKRILTYLFTRLSEIFDIKHEKLDYDLMLRNVDELIDFMQHGLGSEKLISERKEAHGNITG